MFEACFKPSLIWSYPRLGISKVVVPQAPDTGELNRVWDYTYVESKHDGEIGEIADGNVSYGQENCNRDT